MKHWLLRRPPHYSEIHPSAANNPWDYDKVFVDVRLRVGDIVYLTAAYDELYGWGHVIKRESYRDPELQGRSYRVTVTRPVVQQNLATAAEIKSLPQMNELFADSNRNLVPLKAVHVNAFNGLLRAKAMPVPADLDSDEPEIERLPKQNFPRVSLTPEITTWLTAVYARVRLGRKVEPTELLVELWSSLPEDFDYNRIDRRLMRFGVEPTLLGILHIDPATDLVEKTHQIISLVRELIRKEPGIGAISSEQISEALVIPEEDVALVFALMSHLGEFWNGGSGYGDKPGYYSVTIRDEKVKREYLRYRSVDHLLEKLGKDGADRPSEGPTASMHVNSQSGNYDVCLSFAGEDREYVGQVAERLRTVGVKVFYDNYEQVSLWGKNLYQHLDSVYRERARYCVVFISKSYAAKLWTQRELESAQARAFEENREYILPVRLDETKLPGVLPTTGYVSNKSPDELAELIVKKLAETEEFRTTPSSSLEIIGSRELSVMRDGSSPTADERAAFFSIWSSLVALERAGQALWEEVSGEALAGFADRQRDAQEKIGQHALFFSESDYEALQTTMNAADFYLNGKTKLSDIYDGRVETQALNLAVPNERDIFMDEQVRAQIQQNKRWLTRYRNLLKDIRSRLHSRIA